MRRIKKADRHLIHKETWRNGVLWWWWCLLLMVVWWILSVKWTRDTEMVPLLVMTLTVKSPSYCCPGTTSVCRWATATAGKSNCCGCWCCCCCVDGWCCWDEEDNECVGDGCWIAEEAISPLTDSVVLFDPVFMKMIRNYNSEILSFIVSNEYYKDLCI